MDRVRREGVRDGVAASLDISAAYLAGQLRTRRRHDPTQVATWLSGVQLGQRLFFGVLVVLAASCAWSLAAGPEWLVYVVAGLMSAQVLTPMAILVRLAVTERSRRAA